MGKLGSYIGNMGSLAQSPSRISKPLCRANAQSWSLATTENQIENKMQTGGLDGCRRFVRFWSLARGSGLKAFDGRV